MNPTKEQALILAGRMDTLTQSLERTPDVGMIQAGREYRIIDRSTGKVLEVCHTQEYALRALESYRERTK